MNSLRIQAGRVIDPANQIDNQRDLFILDGKVAAFGGTGPKGNLPVFNAEGLVVCPGLIDAHVHLREPGQGAKETIATGTAAAARGGFASVVCMPNTAPVIDNPGTVALIREKAQREAAVNVYVTGAITKNLEGEEMSPIGSLKQAGVVAITDDGRCLQSNELMRRAVEYAHMFELVVLDHCQDYSLVSDGVMHEGYWSTILGLKGWPAAGEDVVVARNIVLADLLGARIHCQHVSSAGSVRLIREARARGIQISGEACPHHFTLTDMAVAGSEPFWKTDGAAFLKSFGPGRQPPAWPAYDTDFKMNPPLRTARDREAVLGGIEDGALEIIASDHAPHCSYEKEVEFDYAPFGITGLETELGLTLVQLYHSGRMSLSKIIEKFTVGPARLLGLPGGTLSAGVTGDVTVFDPNLEWVFDRAGSCSKSGNTPFHGWVLKGRAVLTMVGGKIVWSHPEYAERFSPHQPARVSNEAVVIR